MIKKFVKVKNKICNLRYFNVVGSSSVVKLVQLKIMVSCLKYYLLKHLKNPKLNIYGNNHKTLDGTCVRDFIDINDIVQIHKLFLEN